METTIYTEKLVLVDKTDPNIQVHLSLENGVLKTEKQTVTIEKVELTSITNS